MGRDPSEIDGTKPEDDEHNRLPFGLSPEYAESYAADGLNFIDLRRR